MLNKVNTPEAGVYYDSRYFAPEVTEADYRSWGISSSVVGMARASGISRFTLVQQAQAINAHFFSVAGEVCSCGLAIPEQKPLGIFKNIPGLLLLNTFGHINHRDQTYTSLFLTANIEYPSGPFHGWKLANFEWYCQVCFSTWDVQRGEDGEILPADHWHPDQYEKTNIFKERKTPREFAWAFLDLIGKDRMKWSPVLSKKARRKEDGEKADTQEGLQK